MTYFNTQIDNEKSTYSIQFETDDKKLFKMVEEACRLAEKRSMSVRRSNTK